MILLGRELPTPKDLKTSPFPHPPWVSERQAKVLKRRWLLTGVGTDQQNEQMHEDLVSCSKHLDHLGDLGETSHLGTSGHFLWGPTCF